ncbi:hypothetical protein [Microcystis phage Mae-JY30]
MHDWNDDTRDGVMFRFWIRAGSEFPGETALAIAHATTPAAYRKALTELAGRKRINLPEPGNAEAVLRAREIRKLAGLQADD